MKTVQLIIVSVAALALAACGDDTAGSSGPATGTLKAALTFSGDAHDVAGMAYRVIAADGDCAESPSIAEAFVGLEEEALPTFIAEGAFGDNHAFADALFVLQPGDYKVCVTPTQENGEPSAICAATEGVFTVFAESTTEGILVSQCEGDPSGALDVITVLNNPPHIDDLDILESKFITTCEEATIIVTASDPDGDALSYSFEVVGGPDGGSLAWDGSVATFSGAVGTYTIVVTVDDGHGGTAQLAFPIHVSECDFSAPEVGTGGNAGVLQGNDWIVCRADDETAWISANNSGTYNGVAACESLGYTGVDAWGGNCGTVCGWCGDVGAEIYDGNGAVDPTSIQFTVTWRCTR